MLQGPFRHQTHDPGRQPPAQHLKRLDLDDGLVPAVAGMEMRRRVIVVVHRDDDTEEPAYLIGWLNARFDPQLAATRE